MQANREKRQEIDEIRRAEAKAEEHSSLHPTAVNIQNLAPDGSYSSPDFVNRGYYIDLPFTCQNCGKEQIWLATQQKWWYEVAKGGVWTKAKLCRPCRLAERRRREEAQQSARNGTEQKRNSKENRGNS